MPYKKLRKGEHNRYNLLAAMNTGALLRCKREHMLNLIRDYTPLPHRVEYVTTLNGRVFIMIQKEQIFMPADMP